MNNNEHDWAQVSEEMEKLINDTVENEFSEMVSFDYIHRLMSAIPKRQFDESQSEIASAESITVTIIAMEIAKGVLQAAGAQVFNSIFGSKGSNVDLASLVRDTLLGVARIVKTEIANEALRRANVNLSALKTRMLYYHNAPSNDRLEAATVASENSVADLKSLGLPGFSSYVAAVSLSIHVMRERMKLINENEKNNIMHLVESASSYASVLQLRWELKGMYSDIQLTTFRIPLDNRRHYIIKGPDGVLERGSGSDDSATRTKWEKKRLGYGLKRASYYSNTFFAPSYPAIKKWKEIVKSLNT